MSSFELDALLSRYLPSAARAWSAIGKSAIISAGEPGLSLLFGVLVGVLAGVLAGVTERDRDCFISLMSSTTLVTTLVKAAICRSSGDITGCG